MTIAAGFRCSDGVVICADRQITMGLSKFQESKIIADAKLNCRPIFTYAGDTDFSLMAIDMLRKSIAWGEQQKEDIVEIVQETLRDIHFKYASLPNPNSDPYVLTCLASFWLEDKRQLFSISGPSLAPIDSFRCIGAGESLGPYVAQMVFDSQKNIHECIYSAYYLMFAAKTSSPYCGGLSEVVMLPDHRHGKIMRMHWQEWEPSEQDLESGFESIHRELREVLVRFGSLHDDRDQYQKVLERFSQRLSEIRQPHLERLNKFYESIFGSLGEPLSIEEIKQLENESPEPEED